MKPVLLVVSLCALLWARGACAQIVNVLPFVQDETEKLSGSLQGGLDWREGNVELRLLRAGLTALYVVDRHLVLLVLRGEIGTKSGERFVAQVFEHLRYRTSITGPWRVEFFVQHESNEFRRLSLRALFGGGLRYERPVFGGRPLAIGATYMAEEERLRAGDEPDAGEETFSHRLSSYVSLEIGLAQGTELVQTFLVQPRLPRFGDVRLLSETSLVFPVIDPVDVRTSLSMAHDSAPPSGVASTDTTLRSTVEVSF